MASSPGQKICDVQELPAPEPMQAVLKIMETLEAGEYVRMMHRMEPVPLYAVLRDMGYQHRLFLDGEAPYEVMIFRNGDELAADRIDAFCTLSIQ